MKHPALLPDKTFKFFLFLVVVGRQKKKKKNTNKIFGLVKNYFCHHIGASWVETIQSAFPPVCTHTAGIWHTDLTLISHHQVQYHCAIYNKCPAFHICIISALPPCQWCWRCLLGCPRWCPESVVVSTSSPGWSCCSKNAFRSRPYGSPSPPVHAEERMKEWEVRITEKPSAPAGWCRQGTQDDHGQ